MALPPLAFLGLGAMGLPMAGRLLAQGFPLTVWNRTAARASPLVERGAHLAATPAEAVREARIALTMLAGPAAVEEVVLGPGGVLEGIARGALLADLSTIGAEAARRVAGRLRAAGVRFVDAPVYGSVRPAAEGSLVVLAGGEAADVRELEPVLGVLARRTFHAGQVGAGATLKLAINATGAHVLTGIATGLALARAAGLGGNLFLEALQSGAFGSPLVGLKGPKMLARDWSPAFSVDLTLKDLKLALEAARAAGLVVPPLEGLVDLFARASAAGLGDRDLAAVFETIAGEGGGSGRGGKGGGRA